ncbi:hypothetical protein IFM89_002744 [Coptis chinensis]|uniref:Uncharacterized protein n=1 Tax=Coptis chinensis TaxID=261450 RepID=A0A835IJE4_9MAGN|nr:hypothetical protein IFM89_002744 [Coptis chinensis]
MGFVISNSLFALLSKKKKNSLFASLFTSPLENELLLKKKSFCEFKVLSNNKMNVNGISCKVQSESEIHEKPTSTNKSKMEEYNTAMKSMMRNPYEYHHVLGMNYTLITDDLIVGSQPQKPEDIDHLKEEQNVAYILNLQQDKDIEYWEIDLQSIVKRCKELGIRHMRRPARDFDPDSLRSGLPKAVSSLEWAISEGKGKVLLISGRTRCCLPMLAILKPYESCNLVLLLKTAYAALTSKRPCGPNKSAIRGATYDLAKNDPWKEPFESLPEHAFEDVAEWERNLIQEQVRALRGT